LEMASTMKFSGWIKASQPILDWGNNHSVRDLSLVDNVAYFSVQDLDENYRIAKAMTEDDGYSFNRKEVVLAPKPDCWFSKSIGQPSVLRDGDEFLMMATGRTDDGVGLGGSVAPMG